MITLQQLLQLSTNDFNEISLAYNNEKYFKVGVPFDIKTFEEYLQYNILSFNIYMEYETELDVTLDLEEE